MKNILNWVLGSFFRTIGKTIAILLIGGLIAYLLSYNDLGIKNLFFDKVNASSFTSLDTTYYDANFNAMQNTSTMPTYFYGKDFSIASYSSLKQSVPFWVKSDKSLYTFSNTVDYVYTKLIVRGAPDNMNFNFAGQGASTTIFDNPHIEYVYILAYYNNSPGYSVCQITPSTNDMYDVKCPVTDNATGLYRFTIYVYRSNQYETARGFTIGLSGTITFEKSGDTSIIEQQQQTNQEIQNQTQQQHQDSQNTQNTINNGINQTISTITDNSLNDTDISNELSYDVPSTSMGPFSGFITLPLTWVQNILAANQTCQNLSLPLPFTNTTLDLPCMSDFWSRLGLLNTLIQMCWICVVGVRIFNGLFLLVVDIKSPNANADQLTKIRSWEL